MPRPNRGANLSNRLKDAVSHRRTQEKEALREAILCAAGELFLEQGYDKFSLRRVAERIGYSATTIYHHFKDKDDLLFRVVDEGYRQFSESMMVAMRAEPGAWSRVKAMGRAYIEFGLANPVYFRMMFMQRPDFLRACSAGEDVERIQVFEAFRQIVEQVFEGCGLSADEMLAISDVMWSTVHGAVTLGIGPIADDPARLERAIDMMFRIHSEKPRVHDYDENS